MKSRLLGSALGLGKESALQGFFFLPVPSMDVKMISIQPNIFALPPLLMKSFSAPSNNFVGTGNVLWKRERAIHSVITEVPILAGIVALLGHMKPQRVALDMCEASQP